jgi:hypothetical protein
VRVVYWLNQSTKTIHKGAYLDGISSLFTNERDNRDQAKHRKVLDNKPYNEWPADLLKNGYQLCKNCFVQMVPNERPSLTDPMADPEAALMDAAAHESEP